MHRPAMRNVTSARPMAGMAVSMRYRIWSKRSTPQALDATTVVSLSGDTLSPKYAPDIMAPATHPGWKPMTVPMPMNATPMVAMVLQELPVSTDMTAQTAHVVTRKKVGLSIRRP